MLAGYFREGTAVSLDGVLKSLRPALEEPECRKRIAQTHLAHCPVVRRALAGQFLERSAERPDRLLKPRRPVLAFPQYPKRNPEIVLDRGPLIRPLAALSRSRASQVLKAQPQGLVEFRPSPMAAPCAGPAAVQHDTYRWHS